MMGIRIPFSNLRIHFGKEIATFFEKMVSSKSDDDKYTKKSTKIGFTAKTFRFENVRTNSICSNK